MSNSKHRPIGFFDSGIGGISVLNTARRLLPQEDFLYFGDNAHAPYGVKSAEEIMSVSLNSAQSLNNMGIKALVVACNTASGVALPTLQSTFSFPVVGIEPALKAAFTHRKSGRILVMATPATLKTAKYLAAYHQYKEHTLSLPCPGLMEFVERGELESETLHRFLETLLSPYQEIEIDAVALGCTHYPFIKPALEKHFKLGTAFVDGSETTVLALKSSLFQAGTLLDEPGRIGHTRLLSSAGVEKAAFMKQFLAFTA